jgi:hypothetical protein
VRRRKLLTGCVTALTVASWSIGHGQDAAGGSGTLPAATGPCRVQVRLVGDEEVTVGQPFTLEVVGEGPAGAQWSFPAQVDADEVELKTAPAAEGQATAPERQRYVALAFAVGEVRVPPIAAECHLADGSRHEVRGQALSVRMRSLLPKDPAERRLVDIRPPLALSVGTAFWVALVVAAAALVGVVTWIVRRRRRARASAEEPAEVVVAADVEAREALARLAREGPLVRDDLRGHYIALAQVAKRYLERRLGAPVLEMTSAETLGFLRRHPHGERVLGSMRGLVGSADRVKFARGRSPREEGERDLRAVGSMVDALEEALRPAPGGAAERG